MDKDEQFVKVDLNSLDLDEQCYYQSKASWLFRQMVLAESEGKQIIIVQTPIDLKNFMDRGLDLRFYSLFFIEDRVLADRYKFFMKD